jgi:hypothetical protein
MSAIAWGTFVAAVATAAVSPALAAGSRVVILREQAGADPVIERARVRVAAELRAAGFEVEERAQSAGADARHLLEEPTDGEPFATVLLQRVGRGPATDVWVADHVTHKTVLRRISAQGFDESATRAFALRVVELMRASLVESIVLPPAQEEPRPPPDVVAWTREAIRESPHTEAPPQSANVALGVGIAGVFAGPELGFAVGPQVSLAFRPSDLLSVRAVAAGPVYGAGIRAVQGDVTARQELGLLQLSLGRPIGRRTANVFAALGAGAYHIDADARGTARAPYAGARDDKLSALVSFGAGVLLHLSGAASIEIDAGALLAFPRPLIAFGTQRVASAMYPGALTALTLTVGL